MRKYLFAAVAVGGLLLLGPAPAHADDGPPAGGLLGGLLDPAGGILPTDGIDVGSPLGEAPSADVDPGDDTPSVVRPLPAEGVTPAARTGLGSVGAKRDRPKPDAETTPAPARAAPARPVVRVLGGLLPDGRVSTMDARESGLLDGDLPLLGALLGGEPVRTLPAGADDPDAVDGLPGGGTDVPAATAPGKPTPAAPADVPHGDDPRPAEEPLGDEAGGRRFSDGRPVAGTDPDYR
jgi:hypothetical protein